MPYSTVSDVQRLLQQTFTAGTKPTDTDVADFITKADGLIDALSGHNWTNNTVTAETHDGIGFGPRAGKIWLRNYPVLTLTKVEYYLAGQGWLTAVEGKPNDFPTQQTYEFYREEGMIAFYKLRMHQPKVYRADYTWGWSTVPVYVSRLSAVLATLDSIAAQLDTFESYTLGDLTVRYPEGYKLGAQQKDFIRQANMFLTQFTVRRAMVGVG